MSGKDTDSCVGGIPPSEARQRLFVQSLPKIELHAHLNGSIRRWTLRELAASKNVDASNAVILSRWPRTLSEAFDVFRVIHSCVTTLHHVERLAYQLGHDLEQDGVVYAEIRTTPRNMVSHDGPTPENEASALDEYVDAVLAGFSRYQQDPLKRSSSWATSSPQFRKVILRLLLSIDRAKHCTSQAHAIVDLAHRYRDRGVVGIDLSGDPTKGDWFEFEPSLTHARNVGLKITLHAGQVPDTDQELSHMLNFHPHRFGHCCFISPANLNLLQSSQIPIELCLTSNLLSNSVTHLKAHHFALHYKPIQSNIDSNAIQEKADATICCISTDDSGVFGSTLSNEYRLVMQTFGLSELETFHLAHRTIFATFLRRPSSQAIDKQEAHQDHKDLQCLHQTFNDFFKTWEWSCT